MKMFPELEFFSCVLQCVFLTASVLNPPQTLHIGTQSSAMVLENCGQTENTTTLCTCLVCWIVVYRGCSLFFTKKERKTKQSQKWKGHPIKIATVWVCCRISGCSENQFISSEYMWALSFRVRVLSFAIATDIKTMDREKIKHLKTIHFSVRTYLAFCFNGERWEFSYDV